MRYSTDDLNRLRQATELLVRGASLLHHIGGNKCVEIAKRIEPIVASIQDALRNGRTNMSGVILAPDDLRAGETVCVHSLKQTPDHAAQILGLSFQVKAICLPFIVGQFLSDGAKLTLDCRFLNLMRVSPEFAAAQQSKAATESYGQTGC
jgi:hypothetical protein